MSLASGLELRHRKRHGKYVGMPAVVLVVAVVLSLAAQVVEAEQSLIGWIAAALPAAGFLAMVKIALGHAVVPNSANADAALPVTSGDHATDTGGPRSVAVGSWTVADHEDSERTSQIPAVPDQRTTETDLETAVRRAHAELTAAGERVTRRALASRLRENGHPIANARVGDLLKLTQKGHVPEVDEEQLVDAAD
jgi:hypothetical protein